MYSGYISNPTSRDFTSTPSLFTTFHLFLTIRSKIAPFDSPKVTLFSPEGGANRTAVLQCVLHTRLRAESVSKQTQRVIPGTAMLVREHQTVDVTTFCGGCACTGVPLTALRMQVLQALQMTAARSPRGGNCTAGAAVLEQILQVRQVACLRGAVGSAQVPFTALGVCVLQALQRAACSAPRRTGAGTHIPGATRLVEALEDAQLAKLRRFCTH